MYWPNAGRMAPSRSGADYRLLRGVLSAALGAALSAIVLATDPAAVAQTASSNGVTVAPEAAKGAREEELAKVQAEQKKSAEFAARLKAALEAIGDERR